MGSFKKKIAILSLFNDKHSTITASEIVHHLDLPLSTTYRYIADLKACGLMEDDAKPGHYRPGTKILELAQIARKALGIENIALPIMQQLAKQTEETVLLLLRRGNKVMCVERCESSHALKFSSDRGRIMCMHAGASSRVIMAYLDELEQDRIIREEGLPRFTKNTITHPVKLKESLKRIRENGFAISEGELDPGAIGIAAPILCKDSMLRGGLSIAGPANRIFGLKVDKFTRLVVQAANEIAKLLNKMEPLS